MKRRRIEFAGEVELVSIDNSSWLSILVYESSVEKWISMLAIVEMGLGELTVVPTVGMKCRLVATEEFPRVAIHSDLVEIAFDLNCLGLCRELLAQHYFNNYAHPIHVDLSLKMSSGIDIDLVFGIKPNAR